MHNIETSNVFLPVHNNTCPPHITTTGNHYDISRIKLDKINDFALFKVELDCVVNFDRGIWVTDRATVVSDNVRNTFRAYCYFANFEEFVGGFFGSDAVDCEAAFDIVEQAEVFAGFLNGNDVHEAIWVGLISPNFSVNFDQTLLDDGGDFTASQGVFQPVAEKDGEGNGFAKFMGTRRWARGVCPAQFVEHP